MIVTFRSKLFELIRYIFVCRIVKLPKFVDVFSLHIDASVFEDDDDLLLGEIHQFFVGDEKVALKNYVLVTVVSFEKPNVRLEFFLVNEHSFKDSLDMSLNYTKEHNFATSKCLFLRLFL